MRRVAIVLAATVVLTPSPARAWGSEAHKFIAARAIDSLPEPLRPFFEANRAFIVERSIDPDLWRNAGFTQEPPNHFLNFDAYGQDPFADLPREYDEAVKKHGIDKLTANGLVPWRTHEMAGRLVRAFASLGTNGAPARNDIRFFSAILGHYVADAHVPLHAVRNYNGQRTGQTGVHYRWESELFVRYQQRLAIVAGPLRPIRHERDFIFETLLESARLADEVLAADKQAIGRGNDYDDRYFETFFVLTRPVLERRMSEAITAVASAIASAWEQAGKPSLSATPPPRTPQRRTTAARP